MRVTKYHNFFTLNKNCELESVPFFKLSAITPPPAKGNANCGKCIPGTNGNSRFKKFTISTTSSLY